MEPRQNASTRTGSAVGNPMARKAASVCKVVPATCQLPSTVAVDTGDMPRLSSSNCAVNGPVKPRDWLS